MRTRYAIILACALVAALGGACRRDPGTSRAPAAANAAGMDQAFAIGVGSETVQMRLAVRPHEQQRGLMYVKSMPEEAGMLFLYEKPQRMSFWMRNTFIPLDIGFFDEAGALREVHAMFPHIEDPVASVAEDIRYALEMNRGWYAAHGITAGARLDLPALARAVEARGFDAARYVRLPPR